jgi:hypothetical protein
VRHYPTSPPERGGEMLRFIRAMTPRSIPLGHAASHSPWSVQAPKPSMSAAATSARARRVRSGWPWGKSPR